LYPSAEVSATDLSIDAISSISKWEKVFDVKIDSFFSASSNCIPVSDSSYDYVYCYESAHHFRDHHSTILELKRVLKKGGVAFYFNEPVCNKFIYPLAFWMTNKRSINNEDSPSPEDLVIPSYIKKICKNNGLSMKLDYHLKTFGRGPIATLYYFCLQLIPFLKYFLPSCANIIITKL
tara:strand:+ start:297 stop:830 length:534 start_codon:yes stop_codon:yes gene_type:complete